MKKNLPLIVLSTILLGVIIYLFTDRGEKIVYIDTIKLLNEFKYKKDLEQNYEKALISSKNHYDSIAVLAKMQPGNDTLQYLLKEEEQRFSGVYGQIKENITQKSWERLDPLIKQFGAEHKFKILIGANGMGTVLYGSEDNDQTQRLIDFVNKEYDQAH